MDSSLPNKHITFASIMDRYFKGIKRNLLYNLIAGITILLLAWLIL